MSEDKIMYYEIGQDKDNPLFKVEYLEESKPIKKEDKTLSMGWTYQVGSVTDAKGKKLDFESRFSVFDASLEYLFDTIGQTLLSGAFGFAVETFSNFNFAISQNTKIATKDKDGREIVFSIDSIGGAFSYNVKIESVDGKTFKGRLPEKIEEHIYKFNNLNRLLKDIKRNPTYDRPKYFYSGLFEEIFELEKLISNESIEINNEVSKKTDINVNNEQLYDSSFRIAEYEISEEMYQNFASKKNKKISLGNLEQYQTVKRGNDEIFLSNTFSVVDYDPKNLSKYGKDAIDHKLLDNATNTMLSNFIKSLNLSFTSNVKTAFKDKNGNIIEAELKLFGANFLMSMKINKVNGQEVTKLPKEVVDIINKYNKHLSGIKYYSENKIEFENMEELHKFTKFLQTNYKRTLDAIFEIQDKLKEIDVTRKDNLEYISDYKLEGTDREFNNIKIRTERGLFTRADKATFKSLDGHQVEIKVTSYLNGMYPTLRVNSVDGIKTNAIMPLRLHLKDSSIDALIFSAQSVVERTNIDLDKKEPFTDKEKEKLLSISHKKINELVSKVLNKIPNLIIKEFAKNIAKDATKHINQHMIFNAASENIREIKFDGPLSPEIIQALYNQNPYLETIINDGKKVNVMDYVDETLEDKIRRTKNECKNANINQEKEIEQDMEK